MAELKDDLKFTKDQLKAIMLTADEAIESLSSIPGVDFGVNAKKRVERVREAGISYMRAKELKNQQPKTMFSAQIAAVDPAWFDKLVDGIADRVEKKYESAQKELAKYTDPVFIDELLTEGKDNQ